MTLIGFILLPFTFLYSLGTRLRNYLFDIQYTHTISFEPYIISVGNLVAGGAGKTPMVEYLVQLLSDQQSSVAVLSRGYKRQTTGVRIAGIKDTHRTIGDEPYQIWRKFGDQITVAVGEERVLAIPTILQEQPQTKIIIMDDAYQHRYVVRDLDILLTTYSKPFYKDFLLPTGRLREPRKECKRADIIVVTKCPDTLKLSDRQNVERAISRYTAGKSDVFFTRVKYLPARNTADELPSRSKVFGFAGIANPVELKSYLKDNYELIGFKGFGDHHRFTEKELENLREESANQNAVLVTTEKDWVRLSKEMQGLTNYIPIETEFIEDGKRFDRLVLDAVASKINP